MKLISIAALYLFLISCSSLRTQRLQKANNTLLTLGNSQNFYLLPKNHFNDTKYLVYQNDTIVVDRANTLAFINRVTNHSYYFIFSSIDFFDFVERNDKGAVVKYILNNSEVHQRN